jgi:lipopolysaccharide biosynthesis protein
MKTRPVESGSFQIDIHKRHGHDKGSFSNFWQSLKKLHTHPEAILSYYITKDFVIVLAIHITED